MADATVPDQDDARDRHRPTDLNGVRAAAVELRRQGLRARDIAQALRLSEAAVSELLERAA